MISKITTRLSKLLLINTKFFIKLFRKQTKIYRYTNLFLNIGCGKAKIKDWINIDIEGDADLILDVRQGLPFKDNSVELVYNEHFIEHLTSDEVMNLLKDIYRCLKPGGLIRIATPDLDYLIQKYNSDWKNQDWLKWPEYSFIKTKCQMLNICFRWWEHKYLYNEEDLSLILTKSGFKNIIRCTYGLSNNPNLTNLETRLDSTLIMEGEK